LPALSAAIMTGTFAVPSYVTARLYSAVAAGRASIRTHLGGLLGRGPALGRLDGAILEQGGGEHLGLDDDRAAHVRGDSFGIGGIGRGAALRHGDATLGKDLLRLELV
jgi:hypothetical protein